MVAPVTAYEASGGITSLAAEATFWQTVDADTAATVTTAGLSVEGRPIYRIDLGAGTDQTVLITSLIHANEPATREALMMWLRDLAYSTDPAVTSYLASHRIVALSPCNPDSLPSARENAAGVNVNRDFYKLTQPETQVIVATLGAVDPHLAIDIHEYHGGAGDPDWMGRGGGSPVTPDAVATQEAAIYAHLDALVEGDGYTSDPYFDWGLMRAGMSTIQGPMNRPGLLSETNTAHTLAHRVTVQVKVLEWARLWHEANAAACTSAVAAGKAQAVSSTEPLPLYTHEYFLYDSDPEVLDLLGYQLAPGETIPATHDAFGITADSSGFVTMQQEAQWVIPTLLDPTSPDVIATATRVVRPVPLPTTELIGYKVWAQGKGRDVTAMKFHDGTRVQDVTMP